ncbi:MAG: PHP domain-containing protein [Nanobdellota archaeon]
MPRVFFEKPNHEMLSYFDISQVDMHFHTKYSDSNVSVPVALRKAKRMGIGLAITDHNVIGGALEAVNNKEGVMVIPGVEVSSIEGPHILLYFYEPKDLKAFYDNFLKSRLNGNPFMAINASAEEILDVASRYDCLKIGAHPYGYMTANSGILKAANKGYISSDVLGKLDGVEGLCGAMNRYLNKKASIYGEQNNLMITGGTDGHCLFQLGRVVTIARGRTRHDFLNSIKDKNNIVTGKEPRALTKILPASSTIYNHAHYAVPTVKLQSRMVYKRAKHFKIKVIKKCKKGSSFSKRVVVSPIRAIKKKHK